MKYTTVGLKEKIMEMYPEIGQQNMSLGIVFSEEKNCYILTLRGGNDVLTTHLEQQDADECMNGIKCVYLGVQVAQFIKNYKERQRFTNAA
jgi:hypothetical protein